MRIKPTVNIEGRLYRGGDRQNQERYEGGGRRRMGRRCCSEFQVWRNRVDSKLAGRNTVYSLTRAGRQSGRDITSPLVNRDPPKTATWRPELTTVFLYGANDILRTVNLGMAPPRYGRIQSALTRSRNDPSILRVRKCVHREGNEGEERK